MNKVMIIALLSLAAQTLGCATEYDRHRRPLPDVGFSNTEYGRYEPREFYGPQGSTFEEDEVDDHKDSVLQRKAQDLEEKERMLDERNHGTSSGREPGLLENLNESAQGVIQLMNTIGQIAIGIGSMR